MSEWVKLHTELPDHPKLHRFTALIGVKRQEAIGHIACLWIFALRFAWRDGNLEKFGNLSIAKACLWDGDVNVFVEALQTCGFLDSYLIHDWHDYAGKLVSDRIYNETKRRKTPLNVVKRPKSSVVESREYNTYASKFENLWKTYPKRQGRKEALRHFIATVKTDVEYDSCAAALRNYVAYIKKNNIEERFIKHGSTFFNNWSEWVTPPTAQIQSEVAAWMK